MKTLITTITLLCLMLPVLADNKDDSIDTATSTTSCASKSHAHQYGDIRIAAVEVSKVDECGFSFADLEQSTVGLDNHFEFSSNFRIISIDGRNQESHTLQTHEIDRKVFKRGLRGVAAYCVTCKAVFSFRPFAPGEEPATYTSRR